MAKLFNGMIPFASAIKPTGAQPLDDRTVVQSFADLLSEDTFGLAKYNGMLVAVVADEQVYMLIDAENSGSEESWVAVGSGNGSLAVETYAEAIAIATNDNIGQVIYVKTKSSYDADGEEGEGEAVEYDAAPYIVIGEGQLQKLAASTASGDLDSDVAELKTKVSTLEGEMDSAEGRIAKNESDIEALKAIDHDAYIAADEALKGELNAEIVKKVNSETYEAKIKVIEDTISENDTKAQGYASAAQAAAIAAAATDATTKADAAEAAAKGHADGLNTEMDTRVKVLEAIDHDAYKTADETLKGELNAEIAKKVNAVEGSRLMSNEEGNKLAGVEAGAQVNKIEVVKVNGTAIEITAADKSVDITVPTAPVQGVANDEKVISLDGDKLKSTLTLAYVPATETEHAVLRLQGIDGAVVSSIDATAFVKDGMLSDAKLVGPNEGETGEKYLSLTFNTDAGSEEIRMDVSDLIDYYSAGDGLNIDGKKFSVKVDTTANTYLQVTTNGISVSQDFINFITTKANDAQAAAEATAAADATAKANAAKDAAIAAAATDATTKADAAQAAAIAAAATDATTKADAAQAAAIAAAATDATTKADAADKNAKEYADGLNTAMNTRVEALEAIDHEHENKAVLDGITQEKVNNWDSAEQNAKDYADGKFVTKEGFNEFEAEYEEKLNGIAAGAEVNVIESIEVNGVEATISNKAASVEITADNTTIGVDIKNGEEVKYTADSKISTVLQSIQESIRGAIAGGVNSVSSGDKAIEVNTSDANNPVVTLKVEESTEETVSEGHISIVKGDNGIYGMMYYDGDDAE